MSKNNKYCSKLVNYLHKNENFCIIKEFPNYAVTSEGGIWSFNKEDWKSQIISRDGYANVSLWNHSTMKRFLVHRLVAEYFVPNPYNLPIVHHINGDKLDNRASNLKYVTHRMNINYVLTRNKDREYHGLSYDRVNKNYKARLQVNNEYHYIGVSKNPSVAAMMYNNYVIENSLNFPLNKVN